MTPTLSSAPSKEQLDKATRVLQWAKGREDFACPEGTRQAKSSGHYSPALCRAQEKACKPLESSSSAAPFSFHPHGGRVQFWEAIRVFQPSSNPLLQPASTKQRKKLNKELPQLFLFTLGISYLAGNKGSQGRNLRETLGQHSGKSMEFPFVKIVF